MRTVKDIEALRKLVRSRATKGMAFMRVDYEALQKEWKERLSKLTRDELFDRFPQYLYDVRR